MRGLHMNGLFVPKPRTVHRASIPERTGAQRAFDHMQALESPWTSLAVLLLSELLCALLWCLLLDLLCGVEYCVREG
jgi:hypothetical protein